MRTVLNTIVMVGLVLSSFHSKADNLSNKIYSDHQLFSIQNLETVEQNNTNFTPELLGLVNAAKEKNALLDSVYVDIFLDYQMEKRKWVLDYENNQLKSREYQYFSDTYDVRFGQSNKWIYNENGLLEIYEEQNRVFDDYDSLFVLDYTYYSYKDSRLFMRSEWNGWGVHGGIQITDNDTIYTVEVEFNSVDYYYQYNEKGLLDKMYWKTKQDWNVDSVYNETAYYYNANDQREFEISYNDENGAGTITKYEYETTDSSKLVRKKLIHSNDVLSVNKDSIQDWWEAWEYFYLYDTEGRDSIYKLNELDDDYNLTDAQIQVAYFYTEYGSFSGAIYYSWRGTLTDGYWFEQVTTDYTYDSDGKLVYYQKNYYDEQYNVWRVQETHEYFYSPIMATNNSESKLSNELTIYPNPASDRLYVQLNTDGPVKYIVYDLYGRQVLSGALAGQSIDVVELAKGTYLLKITNNDYHSIKRFVKM